MRLVVLRGGVSARDKTREQVWIFRRKVLFAHCLKVDGINQAPKNRKITSGAASINNRLPPPPPPPSKNYPCIFTTNETRLQLFSHSPFPPPSESASFLFPSRIPRRATHPLSLARSPIFPSLKFFPSVTQPA